MVKKTGSTRLFCCQIIITGGERKKFMKNFFNYIKFQFWKIGVRREMKIAMAEYYKEMQKCAGQKNSSKISSKR